MSGSTIRPSIEQRLEMAQFVRAKEPGLLCDLGMCSVFGCECREDDGVGDLPTGSEQ